MKRFLTTIATKNLTKNGTGYEQLVGNTRLIRLAGPSELTGCEIYGKCEWENPGSSIKDRAALWMIKDAEKKKQLIRGQKGIIIEGTAGNTGNSRGYHLHYEVSRYGKHTDPKKYIIL